MSLPASDYPSFSTARAHLKEVLDQADSGRVVTVTRRQKVSDVISVDKLRRLLFLTVQPQLHVAHEAGRVITFMESRPFLFEGFTVDDALEDMIESLREYAEDWVDHLAEAPSHVGNWGLVQLVNLSSDQELREWFERDGEYVFISDS